MKRWLIIAVLVLITACSTQPTPTPTSPDLVVPTNSIATLVPIPTLLPTITVPPSTRSAETIAPTVVPPKPAAQATRAPATRLGAPVPKEPQAPTLFKDGNDIKFVYNAVGKLEPNQCYLLHIEMAIPGLAKGNRGDDFLDAANCGNQAALGQALEFVLYRGKFTNSPNYGTMLAQIRELSPEVKDVKMTWTVRVVQNNGRAADGVHYNTVDLSPTSPVIEFGFQP